MIETIRPKLDFLSEALIQKILDEAYELLEKQGIVVENQEALTLLKEAGMKVDDAAQAVSA